MPGETGTHAFSTPPPLRTPKWVKSDVRRGRRQPPPSNLSPAARCHVLSVIRSDGLYTRPRRPGRARITTRAHNTLSLTHTHAHINAYNTYIYLYIIPDLVGRLLGFLRRFRLFLRFSSSLVPQSHTYCRLKLLRPPESPAKSLRAFYPQPVYVFVFRNSLRPPLLHKPEYTTATASGHRKYIHAWQSFTYHNIYKKKDLTTPTRAVIASANSRIDVYIMSILYA